MYTIEETSYGFRITHTGAFSLQEAEQYKSDVIETLAQHDRAFSLLIDSRQLVLPTPDVLELFAELHDIVWQMSCLRAAIIVQSPVAKGMAVQACSTAKVVSNDRVIDTDKDPHWEAKAIAWVAEGVEPVLPSAPDCNTL